MTAKIALFGFGSSPVVFRHLIDLASAKAPSLDWCVILTSPHYRTIMREVLADAEILDVFKALPRVPEGGDGDELQGYVGSLSEDLAAQKRQWRDRSGRFMLARGHDYYRLYKNFLRSTGATHLLTLKIESPDAKILIAVARELGLGVMAATDLRNLTGTMLSRDAVETPPAYARATSTTRRQAEHLIAGFRAQWMPPRGQPREIDPDTDDCARLPGYLPPIRKRIVEFGRTWRERPDLFDPVYIRDSVMNTSRLLQRAIWGTRARLNAPRFHLADVSELPRRFVFYPLQYTPESSINTPAPFFVDQMRVIDALRFAMPSDHTLVVKEHWSCLPLRPVSFMPRIMRLPGVVVASHRLPARELIERASLTVSVTGTAAFEAFLAGRSALALGPGLSAWALGGVAPLGTLDTMIRQRLGKPLSEDVVIDRVATLLDCRYPFFLGSPHMAGEPMLRRGNLSRLLSAIVDHIARDRTARPELDQMAAGA